MSKSSLAYTAGLDTSDPVVVRRVLRQLLTDQLHKFEVAGCRQMADRVVSLVSLIDNSTLRKGCFYRLILRNKDELLSVCPGERESMNTMVEHIMVMATREI